MGERIPNVMAGRIRERIATLGLTGPEKDLFVFRSGIGKGEIPLTSPHGPSRVKTARYTGRVA